MEQPLHDCNEFKYVVFALRKNLAFYFCSI